MAKVVGDPLLLVLRAAALCCMQQFHLLFCKRWTLQPLVLVGFICAKSSPEHSKLLICCGGGNLVATA